MVRPTYVDINGIKKGAWTEEEDDKLRAYIQRYGHWNWRLLPKFAGLERCGKSCRLRWVNYLKPGMKHGNFSQEEEDLVMELHQQLGNKWSAIASRLPGRTDNEVKNFWHTNTKKRGRILKAADPQPVINPAFEEDHRNLEKAASTSLDASSSHSIGSDFSTEPLGAFSDFQSVEEKDQFLMNWDAFQEPNYYEYGDLSRFDASSSNSMEWNHSMVDECMSSFWVDASQKESSGVIYDHFFQLFSH